MKSLWLRFVCFWNGHAIEAGLKFEGNIARPVPAGFVFHCTRCKRKLPGPRP